MLRINQLKLAPDHTEQELKKLLLTTLHLKEEELLEYHIHKRSIDARKKPTIFYSYAIDFQVKNEELILGPFQGKIACTNIPLAKGVCGKAASSRETVLVEDVHQFEGHIACDNESNSEIVVPLIKNNQLYGVLDLDSTSFGRFSKEDQIIFEEIAEILVQHL